LNAKETLTSFQNEFFILNGTLPTEKSGLILNWLWLEKSTLAEFGILRTNFQAVLHDLHLFELDFVECSLGRVAQNNFIRDLRQQVNFKPLLWL
jgi:hypothetical protein